MSKPVPPCRVGTSDEQLQREADRAALYGACLLVLRPEARIKPHLRAAVEALLPAVQAFFRGDDPVLAAHAERYAAACDGLAFLHQKAAQFQARYAD